MIFKALKMCRFSNYFEFYSKTMYIKLFLSVYYIASPEIFYSMYIDFSGSHFSFEQSVKKLFVLYGNF